MTQIRRDAIRKPLVPSPWVWQDVPVKDNAAAKDLWHRYEGIDVLGTRPGRHGVIALVRMPR